MKILAMILLGYLSIARGQQIDTSFSKLVDVTGNGILDTVQLHLEGTSWNTPVSWTLTFHSDGRMIYSYSEDGTMLEDRFREEGGNTKALKQAFFFKEFAELKVGFNIKFGSKKLLFNRNYSGSVYSIAEHFLENECQLTSKRASRITENLANKLRLGKAIVVIHSANGFHSSSPMVFVKEVHRLVPVYGD